MNSKIPCDIIKDLLPSYIENLTAEKSNEYINEHLNECEDCKNVFENMKSSTIEEVPVQSGEIDFLKKNKKRNKKIIISSIAVVLVIAIISSVCWIFNSRRSGAYFFDVASYSLDTDGHNLTVGVEMKDEDLSIVSMQYEESDGDIFITSYFEKPFFNIGRKEYLDSDYYSENSIQRIYIDSQLVWKKGSAISTITNDLFESRHLYVGAMSENADSAFALNLGIFGSYENQLHTAEEPYAWDITFKTNFSKNKEKQMKKYLKGCGYALIATIDNLDTMNFIYSISGKKKTLTVNEKQATEFAGEDIKKVGQDEVKLQKLLEKSGVLDFAENYTEKFKPIYVDFCDLDIENLKTIAVNCYVGKDIVSTQGLLLDENDQGCQFYLCPADFDLNSPFDEAADSIYIDISVTDFEGTEYHISDSKKYFTSYYETYYYLLGNIEDGFTCEVYEDK